MSTRLLASGRRRSAWGNVSHDWSFWMEFYGLDVCTLTLHLKVQLKFDSSFTAVQRTNWMDTWTNAINAAFDNKFKLVPLTPAECEVCRTGIVINVYVEFTDTWTWTDDFEVTVGTGANASTTTQWNTGDPATAAGTAVVRQVGHMLGLEDEFVDPVMYPGKTASDLPVNAPGGFMHTLGQPLLERYLRQILFGNVDLNAREFLPCKPYNLVPV